MFCFVFLLIAVDQVYLMYSINEDKLNRNSLQCKHSTVIGKRSFCLFSSIFALLYRIGYTYVLWYVNNAV